MRISQENRMRLAAIEISLARLDTAIITRYPDSSRAAEEYEALRKGVMTLASASVLHQHSLISLANSIDDGATPETVRAKIVDLLHTLNVQEVTYEHASELPQDLEDVAFLEVGDAAKPRSAWVRVRDSEVEVVQKGYVHSRSPREELPSRDLASSAPEDSEDPEKDSDQDPARSDTARVITPPVEENRQ